MNLEHGKMTRRRAASLMMVLIVAAAVPLVAAGDTGGAGESAHLRLATAAAGDLEPSRVVIGFRGSIPDELPDYVGAVGGELVMSEPSNSFIVISLDPVRGEELLAAAKSDARVAYAEFDMYVKALYTPNDVLRASTQATHQGWVKLPQAWDVTRGSHAVQLHILDTGVDYTHADLIPNLSPVCNGPTFIGRGTTGIGAPGGQESGFHGTHVAGIASAAINNTLHGAGASNSCITSVRVLAVDTGLATWVAAGILWSASNGADIISMSLGAPAPSSVIGNAVQTAYNNGVFVVAAAGNDGCPAGGNTVGWPAAYPQVMAVAALAALNGAASFSSCGPDVEISAPGSNIWSTLPGNAYGPLSGTSMATPYVSGVAGLVLAKNINLSNTQLRCILQETATPIGSVPNNVYGYGRLNAEAAVLAASVPGSVGC